ncbi:helix-turn-helix domain-containing protein [Thermoleptolyngbya sp. M55_K2018_002]|uniref:helix-turn-helix domain-containing protein n=1 Tax=Thermoleptolyngbya sp. M55_K2018_002 TaxID=2747808 RepID=UPI0019FD9146|nr:helix-turn-helix domain-containing protein [Thermoleptolyngbya sp. M55_K2018_002]HIK42173.1 helix-turn-helix domain-containing protein [Thermoleptolyngbya sp. M55_K2018_002]
MGAIACTLELSAHVHSVCIRVLMPEAIALSAGQRNAIALLLSGKTHKQVAAEIGVSTKTIQRWKCAQAFQLEMKRRKELGDRADEHIEIREAAIAQSIPELDEWTEQLDEHVEWLSKAAKTIKVTGFNAIVKASNRIRDLPSEAFKPADAIALGKWGAELVKAACDIEAELLGLGELAERVSGIQEE